MYENDISTAIILRHSAHSTNNWLTLTKLIYYFRDNIASRMDKSNKIKELMDTKESAEGNRSSKTLFRDNDVYNRCVACGVEKLLVEEELSSVIAQLEKFRKMEQEAINPSDEDLQEILTEFGEERVQLEEKLFMANELDHNAWQEFVRLTDEIKELTMSICVLDCELDVLNLQD